LHDLGNAADDFSASGYTQFLEFNEAFFEIDIGITFKSNANNDDSFLLLK
jgi:hypothetical protein